MRFVLSRERSVEFSHWLFSRVSDHTGQVILWSDEEIENAIGVDNDLFEGALTLKSPSTQRATEMPPRDQRGVAGPGVPREWQGSSREDSSPPCFACGNVLIHHLGVYFLVVFQPGLGVHNIRRLVHSPHGLTVAK